MKYVLLKLTVKFELKLHQTSGQTKQNKAKTHSDDCSHVAGTIPLRQRNIPPMWQRTWQPAALGLSQKPLILT